MGNLEPDQIIQEGIKVMQSKLALMLHTLTGETDRGDMNGDFDGPRSPDMGMADGGWQDQGYTTPYGNAGNQSAWGGAATTPYNMTTPYGTSGQSGWH